MWPDEGSGIPKLLLHPSNPTYNGAVESTFTSLPFGDGLATSGTNADANHHARLDHDTETNSDHAQFRQYSSTQGRWMSADWTAGASAVPYATLTNPQSLNLYAYVGNDPNDGQDPNGHARYDGRLRSAVGDYNNYDESEMEQQADFLQYLDVQGETNSSPPTTDTSSAPASSNSQNHGTAATTAGSTQQQNVPTSKKTFTNADAAATAALDAINKQSDREGVEYGGRVVQLGKNKFKYTLAVTQGDPTGVDVDAGGAEGSRIPAGSTNAGIYHTHPSVPGHDAYRFSYDDVYHATHEGVPNYVERPDGSIMKFDYSRTSSSSMYDPNKQVILRPEQ